MNLVLDIGNTRVKAALFNKDVLEQIEYFDSENDVLNNLPFIRQAKKAIIGSVTGNPEGFLSELNALLPSQLFSADSKTPLKNTYQSVSTLGSDRLAASVGAFTLYHDRDVLVVDAGTCIKYNFTNSANEYLGGGISPGLSMRFKALHAFTSKLPLVEADFGYNSLIGTNTTHSILSGVLNGTVAEIEGTISRYTEQYTDLICVITGGDSEHFAKRLKKPIFTHQNLVLRGLNHILNCTNLYRE